MIFNTIKLYSIVFLLITISACAQEMSFEEYNPKSTLVVAENII